MQYLDRIEKERVKNCLSVAHMKQAMNWSDCSILSTPAEAPNPVTPVPGNARPPSGFFWHHTCIQCTYAHLVS